MSSNKTKFLPDEWTTFDGRKVSISDIDHQHLSNTYWFMKIFWKAPDAQLWQILEQIQQRFDGRILDYHPRVDFKEEIAYLRRKGMITSADEIIYNGEIIGRLNFQISN